MPFPPRYGLFANADMEVVTTSVSRYGFTEATAGTCERGAAERARQDALVQAAGGMCSYLRGARPRGNKSLTDAADCGIMQEAEGHDKPPVSAA